VPPASLRRRFAALVWALLPLAAAASTPQDALQRAVTLVQEGRLEEADHEAQQALSAPETRAAACSVLGAIRVQQERFGDAVELLEEAVRLEPGLLGAHLNLAQVYSIQGEMDAALRVFRRVLELEPSNPTARLALARDELERGRPERSLELAGPVRDALLRSPEGLLILLAAHLQAGDREAAAELVDASTRLQGAPEAFSIRFAQLLADGGRVADAIDVLERAKRAAPESFELAVALGGAYVLSGSPAWGLQSYDRALSMKPTSIPALRQAAAVAEHYGELERSLSYWMRIRKLVPDDPEVLLGFGRVCLKMDLLQDADEVLTQAAALRPGELAYQYTLAVAKVGRRQYDAAEALLRPLAEERPEDPQIQYALGTVLYTQGRLDEAEERLRESVRVQPDQVTSHHYLALIARDRGRDAEAIERLEELLQRHPDHQPSCEVLGNLLMDQRRYAEAERFLRRAVHLRPGSTKAHYQLGLLLARTGRKDAADEQLELARSLREEDEATSRLQLRLLDPEE